MVKAQQWLNEMFTSLAGKEKVKRLCIRLNEGTSIIEQTNYEFFNVKLEGELDLNEFKRLEDLAIWGNGIGTLHPITDLKINLCSKLKKLHIDCTNLSELNLRSNQETTSLTIEGCVNLLKIEGLEMLLNLQNLKLWNKNSQLKIPFGENNWKQGLQELNRKKIHSIEEKVNKNEQILKELANMVLPNIAFDLEQQINDAKNKIESIPNTIIDLLLETQEQIIGENGKNDPLVQAQLTGQIKAYQSILEKNLSKQELQALLDKKAELIQLKEQIDKLQTE
ncbi:hypothetical protein C1646_814405 [Rhizophagus diaphanus]|nr:hypothetical protein C1646_814405 [Rhizophagus diaphanus] [Rhizophagus sp. MUCL 43196]